VSVIWRVAARADLIRIVQYIAEENPVAARQVARELVLAGDSLTMFPRRGRRGRALGTRELVTIQPYVIVYETDGDAVTVLRVWHGAQQRS
jgi:plasmid stabilization system protein ParE